MAVRLADCLGMSDKRREMCVMQTRLAELFLSVCIQLKTRVRTEDFSATLPGFGYSPEDEHKEYGLP